MLPRGHLLVLNRSFRRTLKAENKSPRTIEAYTDAVRLLATYCQAYDSPLLADQLTRWKPATAHNRYRACTPSSSGPWPRVISRPARWTACDRRSSPSNPWTWFDMSTWRGCSKICEGRDFTSRRDTAVILLLVDTGMRRAECVGMTLDDVDLDQRIVWVLGKGRRPRALPIGRKTAQALDRYLRGPRRAPAGPPAAPMGRPLCGPAFLQVAVGRRPQSNVLSVVLADR
jgi:integrase/recombinase XerC